jgi:hypothetical protein
VVRDRFHFDGHDPVVAAPWIWTAEMLESEEAAPDTDRELASVIEGPIASVMKVQVVYGPQFIDRNGEVTDAGSKVLQQTEPLTCRLASLTPLILDAGSDIRTAVESSSGVIGALAGP